MAETVSAPVSAPAAASAAPSTPSSSVGSSTLPSNSGVKSPSDIFADLERQMGLGESAEHRPGEAQQYRDGNDKDLETLGGESEGDDVGLHDGATQDPGTEEVDAGTTEEEPQFPAYKFEGKIGDKDYAFEIRDQDHLDKIVTRAIHAERLYQQNKELQPKMKELQELKDYREQFDLLASESPHDLMDLIVEDMDEEQVKSWIMKTAEHLSKPKEIRDTERRLKNAELLERKLEMIQQREEQVRNMRRQAMQEADKKAIQTWQDGWVRKTATKIPEQYLDIVKDRLYDTRREARERQENGETISLKSLDRIFARKMKPVLDLINSGKGRVTQEVGKTLDQKRAQNVDKMRAAASSHLTSGTKPQTRMQRHTEGGNVFGMFDEIMSGLDSGRIRIKGE